MKNIFQEYSGFLVFIFVFVLGLIISPVFRSFNNMIEIFQSSSELGLIATGMTFVILAGGDGIDLSVGSNIALGCMLAAVTQAQMGFSVIGTLLTVIVICGAIGVLNGILITKGNFQPFVATLVTMIGARALALLSNRGMPVSFGIPEKFLVISRGGLGPIYFPIFIWVIIILFAQFVIKKTHFGRSLMAVGGNEKSALFSGINVKRVRFLAFTISGILAGLAGIILCARLGIGEPRSGQGMEMMAIAAVVIGGTSMSGGRGNFLNTMFGVLTLGIITNLLNIMGVNMHLQGVVEGLVVLIAILIPSLVTLINKKKNINQELSTE